MQEDDIALPLFHHDSGVGAALKLVRQLGHFMIVRRKKRAAVVALVQVLQRGPSNREAIIRRRAAPNLVENNKRTFIRLIEDRGGFHHLDHKSRAPPCQIITRAHTAEKLAHNPHTCRHRRHIASHLCQHSNQRVLA